MVRWDGVKLLKLGSVGLGEGGRLQWRNGRRRAMGTTDPRRACDRCGDRGVGGTTKLGSPCVRGRSSMKRGVNDWLEMVVILAKEILMLLLMLLLLLPMRIKTMSSSNRETLKA